MIYSALLIESFLKRFMILAVVHLCVATIRRYLSTVIFPFSSDHWYHFLTSAKMRSSILTPLFGVSRLGSQKRRHIMSNDRKKSLLESVNAAATRRDLRDHLNK